MPAPESHRQLLVRCEVTNRAGEPGVRYVEHSVYRLWQYMMSNKHDISVVRAAVCLWLPEAEWQDQSRVFQRAGQAYPVKRINLMIYDDHSGYCNTLQRFVAAEDASRVQQLLRDKVPLELAGSDDFVMALDEGHAIVKNEDAELSTLGSSLNNLAPATDW